MADLMAANELEAATHGAWVHSDWAVYRMNKCKEMPKADQGECLMHYAQAADAALRDRYPYADMAEVGATPTSNEAIEAACPSPVKAYGWYGLPCIAHMMEDTAKRSHIARKASADYKEATRSRGISAVEAIGLGMIGVAGSRGAGSDSSRIKALEREACQNRNRINGGIHMPCL